MPRPGRRVPPVLHVALEELARGRAEDVRPAISGRGVDQRHDVLELVAEPVGAARLVEARPRPEAAGEHLVEQPSVGQEVERGVGRAHLHGAKQASQPALHVLERLRGAARLAVASDQARGPRRRRRPRRAGRRSRSRRRAGARSGRGSRRRGRARHRRGPTRSWRPIAAGAASEPCRPRNVRRSAGERARPPVDVGERHPLGEVGAERVAGQQGAGLGVHLGHDVHGRGVAVEAQHPLGVEGRRQPRAAGRSAFLTFRRISLTGSSGGTNRVSSWASPCVFRSKTV